MGTSQAAPYVIAAYALTLIVILAYAASILARRRSLRRDLAAAREALDGVQGIHAGGQVDSDPAVDDLGSA